MSPQLASQDLGLKDRVILITGAGRGLGRAYALTLGRHGATVVVHDAGVDPDGRGSDPSCTQAVADQIRSDGGTAAALTELLGDAGSARRLIGAVLDRFGRLDGLVHNAGLVIWCDTAGVDEDTFARQNGVGTDAAFWLSSAALPAMRAQGYGRIVLTSSGWALKPSQGSDELALYCLGKGAQLGLAMALAEGAGHPDLRTNVIVPVANTRIFRAEVPPDTLRPEDVAGAVAWLASPACTLSGGMVEARDGNLSLLRVTEVAKRNLGAQASDPVAAGAALVEMAS